MTEKVKVYAKASTRSGFDKNTFTIPLSRTPLEDEVICYDGDTYRITEVIHNVDKAGFEVMAEKEDMKRWAYPD